MLTDRECRNATSLGLRIRKVADTGGLYLWVYENGQKYWRFRYRIDGKEQLLSLGVYPDVSLKEARNRRDEERRHLAANRDPGAERRAEKLRRALSAENSLEAVAREWFERNAVTWTPRHAADVLRRLETNVFPYVGRRPIAEIAAPELLATVRKIESRGAHDLSHRVLQVCGQVFRYGIATARCAVDPTRDLRGALTPNVTKHQPAVRPEEVPELARAIATYDTLGDRQTRLALQLLMHTFVRTNELIGAEWTEFDLGAALWAIPATRMKMKTEHLVPLSRQALEILGELRETCGGSRYLFPGRNRDRPISNNTILFALYRLGYKSRMTGHGFRAVASTMLNEAGFRADVVERQLAHCERNEVRSAYNRAEYLAERKAMMQWWGEHLADLTSGAKVVPFQKVA